MIVDALADPAHWLKARVAGVRLGPLFVRSRFGIELEVSTMRAAARLLAALPADVEVCAAPARPPAAAAARGGCSRTQAGGREAQRPLE